MKKTLTIIILLAASLASAANFDKRLHLYSQDYTTVRVRWVRDYVTMIDSVTITLPKDTVLTLDDAYNWQLEYRWMNAAGDSAEGAGPVITRKAITVTTNSDKTGYSLTQTFPTNFADLAITSSTGRVTVGTNADKTGYTASTVSDKTGYSLTQTFPTNFADLAITSSTGRVTVGTNADKTGYTASTVSDKTGYSLTTAPLTPGDTSALRANIAAAVGADVWTTAKRDSALLALGKIDALPVPLKPSDTDEFRANMVAAIGANVWTTAKRDSILLALGKLDAANGKLDDIVIMLDSIGWRQGNNEDAFSISVRTTNVDTLKFGVGSTLTHYRVYYHTGGYAGKPPDSTRTYAY